MIETYLKQATNPCLLLSGGMDSVVLLNEIRKFRDIDCVTFNQDFTKAQQGVIDNLIKLWDLQVTSYPPVTSYIVPNGDELARIDEYSFGETILPVLRDFVHDDARCALDLEAKKLPFFEFPYDYVFIGSRKDDHGEAMGHPVRQEVTKFANFTLVAPLFYKTREEVVEMAKGLPLAAEDTGNIICCSNCLKGTGKVYCPQIKGQIDSRVWDRDGLLVAFQEKFGFEATI